MSKKKTDFSITFDNVDFWGRPVYRIIGSPVYLCSVDIIFPNTKIAPNGTKEEIDAYFKEHLDQLVIHGTDLEGDPLGTNVSKTIKLKIV